MLSLEEACAKLREFSKRITENEIVGIEYARGRILAEDIVALQDQPPFPRSPFDGYAIRSEDSIGAGPDSPAILKVLGEVDAGGWFEERVHAGEAVRIMTGAPIPNGADAIIKQEETNYGEETVEIYRQMRYKQNYIAPGEDYPKGTLLLPKGTYLGPTEIGIVASTGRPEVTVLRRPNAVLISTGDELKYPGDTLGLGQIFDSNLYTLKMQLQEWGVHVPTSTHVPDVPEEAVALIEEWVDRTDMIITSGGVSVGKKDIMHDVFDRLGIEPIFWKVGMKPGASMLAGRYKDTLILALSGNPYASYVDLHMLVRPVLCQMTGTEWFEMVRSSAILVGDYDRKSPIRRFIRVHVQDGKAYFEGHNGGNGDVLASRNINAMIDVPAGSGELHDGDKVAIVMI